MNDWILQISSGTGPISVRKFVAQLAERLADEAVACHLELQAVIHYGSECAPRTVQLQLRGDPRELEDKTGTYVLIARSEARKRHGRKRWFAGVKLFAYDELYRAGPVDAATVTFSTARSGGPGGQHVNRTESAVRAVHEPTKISVRVTSERSQHANKRRALALIGRALAERYAEQRVNAGRERRRHHYEVVRGNAVRAFRLDRRGRLVEGSVTEG